jgi:hypothetical protein
MNSSHTVRVVRGPRSVAGIAAIAFVLLAAAPSRANEFTINACQADRTEFSTQAFEDFANRGMMWKRACDPEGPGLRGLVTANVVRAGRVVRGSRSYFMMEAPGGTRFSRLTWSGQARRQDCRYALQLWAARPDGSSVAIKNVRANRGCPNPGRAQAAGWPSAHTYDIGGATKIIQRVLCVGGSDTPYCSSRGLNYIRTFKAQATVVDTSPPAVAITQDNAFTRGEWVSGTHQVNYAVLDNVGVRVVRALVGGLPRGEHIRGCNFALPVPCPNEAGDIALHTDTLPEGSQPLVAQAEDAAGNSSDSTAVTVRIDHTAPGAVPVTVEGGESWRRENGFRMLWSNPGEVDRAPVDTAHYRLCPVAPGECVVGSGSGPEITELSGLDVPHPGEWQLRLWRGDAAGNQEPANASVPVTLRFDPEPPQLGFQDPAPSDPTLVSALVSDKVSGLAGGAIELSSEGSNTWHLVPTHQEGSRLEARIDDAHLAPGRYLLRATAQDQAGNQSTSDRRLDGSVMTLQLPLRAATTVRAGIVTRRTLSRTGRHGGNRRKPPHRHTRVLVQRARVPFGHAVKIAGQVKTHDGRPLPGAQVQILAWSAVSPEQSVALLRADGTGRYAYSTRADSTMLFRVFYAGTSTWLPAQAEVELLVRAASTIRAHPRRVRNGHAVTFAGHVRSLPVPVAGKLVELQVVLSDRWQTFRTVRTNSSGAWRMRYRFRRSCGVLRYRFRARLPAEAGYPFERASTNAVGVRVRGRPCR